MIQHLEAKQEVKYDEWKWKVSYGVPAHAKEGGKDAVKKWGKSSLRGNKTIDEDSRSKKSPKRRSMRFSWRRKRRDGSVVSG